MAIRMLIDASHEEETRVAVVRGNRVEEFDYESTSKKPLKGNIYLAKVTRVEPSLQAAFVDYGGNRHGFLAFSEIHPDYYQIPVADREALIAQEAAANVDILEEEAPAGEIPADTQPDNIPEEEAEFSEESALADETAEQDKSSDGSAENGNGEDISDEDVESLHADDEEEEARIRLRMAKRLRHKYKIQEVIKKRQIILVQVVKEERGNKGAALTTYLSLPGRYCVLMPNTLHGGGVSRKISSGQDRKRLKTILSGLNMPQGMACIIRTAGASRTKLEVKRDYDYLNRMWEKIRELTLKSIAPALIYEEGNLIKRSIRDLYTREIDEIFVEGEEGYKTAKTYMKLLMPSHAKKVQHYQDEIPLLQRFQVESHLDSMYNPSVQLRSGGYIVINPTEALVSIDVNSGKATKEHNIEETAYKTNMEAAEEIARQLKLRDMAGLIVIDFIDMEDRGNIRSVERKIKDCLKSDRARIQVGKISTFGLMEMSRQRLRAGVLESSTRTCPHCDGTGVIRSVESQSLHILRVIEEEGIRKRTSNIVLYLPANVAIYILNQKRQQLMDLEQRHGFSVGISIDESLTENGYRMDRTEGQKLKTESKNSLQLGGDISTLVDVTEDDVSPAPAPAHTHADDEDREKPKRKRRRRRRKPRADEGETPEMETGDSETEAREVTEPEGSESSETEDGEKKTSTRRRRPRRRNRRDRTDQQEGSTTDETPSEVSEVTETPADVQAPVEATETGEAPKKPRRRRTRKPETGVEVTAQTAPEASPEIPQATVAEGETTEKPKRRRTRKPKAEAAEATQEIKTETPEAREPAPKQKEVVKPAPAPEKKVETKAAPAPSPFVNVIEVGSKPEKKDQDAARGDDKSTKKGWWQRTFGD
ncbi:Rne/Rng family ribonuclease [Emcibacter sp.]|uniref:Rne/Rng family ribonuclease n=1 Tax=Emcibacter sp. TaxID=1979954 RepID=UPI002AA69408|nr:Rne/Rng family ribonuclease [Emcibacter sp.]